jgi:glycogen(starch) synthase
MTFETDSKTVRLVVSGDKFFLDRYRGLLRSLADHVQSVEPIPSGNLMELMPVRVCNRLARGKTSRRILQSYLHSLDRHVCGYAIRSKQTERKIAKLMHAPNFVLHVFSSFAPFWTSAIIPYAMYLDYTMALAHREWPPWADFQNDHQYLSWLKAETRSHEQAAVLFTMGANAKRSLVADYGIPEDKIYVIGSGGSFECPYEGKKHFGSKRILFQGSEFERKGGDILLSAFRLVRQRIPDAELTIIGTTLQIKEPGVRVLGYVKSRDAVTELFLQSDLVVAPARCDPFTAFVIEAMNYGVPCIVTRTSGISEVITDGVNGVLVDRPEPDDVVHAIITLLQSAPLLERISANGRRLVSAQLNWDVVAASIGARLPRYVDSNAK